MAVQMQVVDAYEMAGQVWYNIRVVEMQKEWLVKKSYDHFVMLDGQLAASSPIQRLPLPEKGVIGFRAMFNIGNFNEKRRDGLNAYLAHIACQLQSLAQVPSLQP